MASCRLSATYDGATLRSGGSPPGASRRAGGAIAGPSAASIMTRRFVTRFAALRGCYLAMVSPYEDRRARTMRALQQTRSAHFRFGSWSFQNVSPEEV